MEEGRDQNKKHGGGYNAVIQSSGIPKWWKKVGGTGGTPWTIQMTIGTTYEKHGLCSGIRLYMLYNYVGLSGLSGFIPRKPTLYKWC